MKNKNFKNIGNVAIKDIILCETSIGLYMPIEEMSGNIRREYEDSENHFTSKVKNKYPEINLTQYTLFRDVALHMNINEGKVEYSVSIILWIENENREEIHSECYDPFVVEINDEDNKYLKKLVVNKLMDSFF
jgi:hypothetical protein